MFQAVVRSAFAMLLLCAVRIWAAEFHTVSGDSYVGEISAADKDGLIVRLQQGGFSPRIDWARLDEKTLKALVDNPRAKRFVEPLIEPPAVEIARIEAKKIEVRQPNRVPRPTDGRRGLVASLTTPNGLILLAALFFANLYAAYEIARFKFRPIPLVCGLSAVLPVVGPLIFVLLPRYETPEQVSATAEAAAAQQLNVPPPPPSASAPPAPAAAGLGMSRGQAATGAGDALPKVFKRGETTFNRRFFETQFPTFFRVVASDSDKDLVLEVHAGGPPTIASRISRIGATDIHFKTPQATETGVDFAAITEVKLRRKDA
jgi:hypothetical protein